MSLNIDIKTIDHSEQRYETPGDYYDETETKHCIRVSALSDWRYEFLIALHELIEGALCRHKGIGELDITAFDMQFEKERREGLHSPDEEPGDDLKAPYWLEHQIATGIERIIAGLLGVNWDTYDKEVISLINGKVEL